MTRSIENGFYRFGHIVGKYPWWTILLSIVLCAVCGSGMALWRTITDDEMLWTPYGSPFIADKKWIEENFPKDSRTETAILSGDNVLKADYIRYLSAIVDRVALCRTSDHKYGFQDLCIIDPSTQNCYVESVLKIWKNNASLIANLTDEDVRRDVTNALVEDTSLSLHALFSNLMYDPVDGYVSTSTALLTVWLLKDNGTKVEGQANDDPVAKDWELVYLEVLVGEDQPPDKPDDATLLGVAERSFDDEIDGAVQSNMIILFIGCSLIFIYIALVLGRFNAVEQRIILSVMGIIVIMLAIFASFGLCFFMQIFYADMHPIIPFLLLGIGVDDMFVIVQSLENLSEYEKSLPVPERIALTMKSAGVSITVTSLTDMLAFLIAATSSMPILRHFCLFSAIGVLFLYIFAATFFVGCLTIDERRISNRKPCPCMKPKPASWTPNKFSQNDFGKIFFDKCIAKYILMLPVKICVLATVLALFGVGVYGVTQMEIDYSPVWYMRESSYQQHFYISLQKYFPEHGEKVSVFVGEIKYWEHLDDMQDIHEVMQNSSYLKNGSIHYWFHDFYHGYCLNTTTVDDLRGNSVFKDEDADFWEEEDFELDCSKELGFKLQLLMFINENRHFYPDIKFDIPIDENSDYHALLAGKFKIMATRATFQHGSLPNTTIQNIAMDDIKDSMARITFDGEPEFDSPIVYSFMYVQWEANKLISRELVRNLTLTFITIVLVTLFMVANLRVSFFVLVCVVFTVVDVAGFAHFMGLTIEIVTSILLILSCGLALDYAAHIGVAYICCRSGSRNDRARDSLVSMGGAVFHGGFSTFTAFALLISSDSYIFVTFFKMFAMVVMFGLFHGLIFLPVILSLVGPENASPTAQDKKPLQQKRDSLELNGIEMKDVNGVEMMNGVAHHGSASKGSNHHQQQHSPEESPKSMTKFKVDERV